MIPALCIALVDEQHSLRIANETMCLPGSYLYDIPQTGSQKCFILTSIPGDCQSGFLIGNDYKPSSCSVCNGSKFSTIDQTQSNGMCTQYVTFQQLAQYGCNTSDISSFQYDFETNTTYAYVKPTLFRFCQSGIPSVNQLACAFFSSGLPPGCMENNQGCTKSLLANCSMTVRFLYNSVYYPSCSKCDAGYQLNYQHSGILRMAYCMPNCQNFTNCQKCSVAQCLECKDDFALINNQCYNKSSLPNFKMVTTLSGIEKRCFGILVNEQECKSCKNSYELDCQAYYGYCPPGQLLSQEFKCVAYSTHIAECTIHQMMYDNVCKDYQLCTSRLQAENQTACICPQHHQNLVGTCQFRCDNSYCSNRGTCDGNKCICDSHTVGEQCQKCSYGYVLSTELNRCVNTKQLFISYTTASVLLFAVSAAFIGYFVHSCVETDEIITRIALLTIQQKQKLLQEQQQYVE